jgi:hypothetical protein
VVTYAFAVIVTQSSDMPTNAKVVHIHKENYDVYIGRPGKWGNPFIMGEDGTRFEVIKKYQEWIQTQPDLIVEAKAILKGKILGCFCSPLLCHGDILLEIANSEEIL